jgi:hypothetical protein
MTRRYVLCGRLPDFPPLPRPNADGVALSRSVRIADLEPAKKRALWAWMKANDAGTAALLASEGTQALLRAFPGASPVVDIDVVRKACE